MFGNLFSKPDPEWKTVIKDAWNQYTKSYTNATTNSARMRQRQDSIKPLHSNVGGKPRQSHGDWHETWAEGNTNQAYRNLMNNLHPTKLSYIKEIVGFYANSYPNDEAVEWLDNNVTAYLVGTLIDYTEANDAIGEQRWRAFSTAISEKCPYLKRLASFESIVLELLKTDVRTLNKLHKHTKTCHATNQDCASKTIAPKPKKQSNASKRQSGGSSSISIVKEFLAINPSNARLVTKILKKYDKATLQPHEVELTYKACTDAVQQWKLPPTHFQYSNRVTVPDAWKLVMFLLSRPEADLDVFARL